MTFTYSAFGLLLRSNFLLPGLAPIPDNPSGPVIDLHVGEAPLPARESSVTEEIWYTSPILDPAGQPALHIWKVYGGDFLRLAYNDGTQFWIDRAGMNLWMEWPEESSLDDAATYLFGPVLGFLLRLKGEVCLHASAVSLEGRVAVFAGEAGAGKSTTAAALARQGYSVVSDDVVRLVERERTFCVQPAVPQLSLWPESVEFLYGSAEALPPFSTAWEKRNLHLGDRGTRFEGRSLPVGAIYILGKRGGEPAPRRVELKPQSALIALVTHSYGTNILNREMRAKEFECFARLVAATPVYELIPHHDPSRLELLCCIVRDDFQSMDKRKSVPS